MSADLLAFVTARLDEDERKALNVSERVRSWATSGGYPETGPNAVVDGLGNFVAEEVDEADALHIAHWDPVRALAEVDAKRRILALHAPVIDGSQSSWTWFAGSESQSLYVVQLLALPYAGHPGYRTEWAPPVQP